MKIVTSGLTFLDIDAYGGCVAYAELLNLRGYEAVAFSSATINESVPTTIHSWNAPLSSNYPITPDDTFILIDVSETDYIEKNVEIDRVEEVIDHHLGYEEFWNKRIGDKTDIQFIGAACTLVYERWINAGLLSSMSETSARLLISGILDNTLNFKADVTTERDRIAHTELTKIANLPANWTKQYFTECETSIFEDIETALINDTKMMAFKNLNSQPIAIGQLVIWDAKRALSNFRPIIENTMSKKSEDWFVNIVSISEGYSYFLASNQKIISWAETIVDVTFTNNLAQAERLWLRKEINKKDIESYKANES
jgi:inorganic pyrophosphatase/exopolyphosphatase